MSDFGRLVTITTTDGGTPGTAASRNRLAAVVVKRGHRVVAGSAVSIRYDGANEAIKKLYADHPRRLTWEKRFFDRI